MHGGIYSFQDLSEGEFVFAFWCFRFAVGKILQGF